MEHEPSKDCDCKPAVEAVAAAKVEPEGRRWADGRRWTANLTCEHNLLPVTEESKAKVSLYCTRCGDVLPVS